MRRLLIELPLCAGGVLVVAALAATAMTVESLGGGAAGEGEGPADPDTSTCSAGAKHQGAAALLQTRAGTVRASHSGIRDEGGSLQKGLHVEAAKKRTYPPLEGTAEEQDADYLSDKQEEGSDWTWTSDVDHPSADRQEHPTHPGKFCLDTDTATVQNRTAVDPWGDSCLDYEAHPYWCEFDYNDEDFTQQMMCCVCGGGRLIPAPDGDSTHVGAASGSPDGDTMSATNGSSGAGDEFASGESSGDSNGDEPGSAASSGAHDEHVHVDHVYHISEEAVKDIEQGSSAASGDGGAANEEGGPGKPDGSATDADRADKDVEVNDKAEDSTDASRDGSASGEEGGAAKASEDAESDDKVEGSTGASRDGSPADEYESDPDDDGDDDADEDASADDKAA